MTHPTTPSTAPARSKARAFQLTDAERAELNELTWNGRESARVYKRARILQLRDQGWVMAKIPEAVGCGIATVKRVCRRYTEGGLKRALYETHRPGVPKLLTAHQEAQIVALVCGPPPTGFAQWSIALLTMEVLKRGIVPAVSRETIRLVLKNHELKPWRKKHVVRARAR